MNINFENIQGLWHTQYAQHDVQKSLNPHHFAGANE